MLMIEISCMDIKNNCQVDLDEEGKYTGQTI